MSRTKRTTAVDSVKRYSTYIIDTALYMANLTAAVNASVLSTLSPAVAVTLKPTTLESSWATIGYLYASVVFLPLYPGLSNILGRKAVLLVVLLLLFLGTAVCSFAPNISIFLVGRVIQGFGSGGLQSMTEVIDIDIQLNQKQLLRFFRRDTPQLCGLVLGPLLGAILSQYLTWRCMFWMSLVVLGASTVIIATFLGVSPRPRQKTSELLYIDFAGSALFTLGSLPLLISISWGGVLFAWSSWHTIVPLSIGCCGLVVWAVYERDIPVSPILPLGLLNDRNIQACCVGTFMAGAAQFSLLYFLPFYFRICQDFSDTVAGAALLAYVAPILPVASVATLAMLRTSHFRIASWSGWAMLAIGCGCLVTLGSTSSVPGGVMISLTLAFGLSIVLTSTTLVLRLTCTERKDEAIQNTAHFIRNLGQAFGVVLSTTLFQNTFKKQLVESGNYVLETQASELTKYSLYLKQVISASGFKDELIPACDGALKSVWYTVLAAVLVGGLLSLLMQSKPLSQTKVSKCTMQHPLERKNMASQTTVETPCAIRIAIPSVSSTRARDEWFPPLEEACSPVSPVTPTALERSQEVQATLSRLDRHEFLSGSTLNESFTADLKKEHSEEVKVDLQGVKMI